MSRLPLVLLLLQMASIMKKVFFLLCPFNMNITLVQVIYVNSKVARHKKYFKDNLL